MFTLIRITEGQETPIQDGETYEELYPLLVELENETDRSMNLFRIVEDWEE